MGMGTDNGKDYDDLFAFDPSTDGWTQKASVGPGMENLVSMGSSSYADLWEYDPSTDVWTQKLNFPGKAMIYPNAMVIGGNGYLLGGGEENWLYDPTTDSRAQKAFFGNRIGGSTFVTAGTGYFGLGSGIPGNFHTDLWQYNPGN